jgi:hypothetical protein
MFKRKRKELTAEDAPDSIAPWAMLDETEIAMQTARLRERWPGRNLVAIARRLDTDAVACFDKGPDGVGKAVLVVSNLDAADGATERHYPGFGDWFDAALADSL